MSGGVAWFPDYGHIMAGIFYFKIDNASLKEQIFSIQGIFDKQVGQYVCLEV